MKSKAAEGVFPHENQKLTAPVELHPPKISLSHHFIDIFCSQFSIFLCSIAIIYMIRLTAQLEIMDLD